MGFFEYLFFGVSTDEHSHGSSDFGNRRERRALLKTKNKGFYIENDYRLSAQNSFKNALVLAPSGSGKTTKIILNNLLRPWLSSDSMVVLDPSGEVFEQSSGFLTSLGFDCIKLDVTSPKESISINPIWHATDGNTIRTLAQLLIESVYADSKNSDTFWTQMSIVILSLLIKMLKGFYPKEEQTLKRLYQLLNQFGEHGQERLNEMAQQVLCDEDFDEYCSFIAMDDKVKLSVIATVKSALFIYSDPILDCLTQKDFDFKRLRDKATVLYLIIPEHKIAHYRSFLSLVFHTLFERLIENDKGNYCYFFLDEFGQYRIENFAPIITTCRKRNIGCMLVLQSVEQLAIAYGENAAKTIFENASTKVFLSGLSLHSSRLVSEMLGHTTQVYNAGMFGDDSKSSRTSRALLTPDEVRKIAPNEAILIHGNKPPFRLVLKAFYEVRKLLKRSKMASIFKSFHP